MKPREQSNEDLSQREEKENLLDKRRPRGKIIY